MAIEISSLEYQVPRTWVMLIFLTRSFSFSILNRLRASWSGVGLVAAMVKVVELSEEEGLWATSLLHH